MTYFRGIPPILTALAFLAPRKAQAHVSEQGLVLLLPTEHYIASGTVSVLASIILISLTPKKIVHGLFTPVALPFAAPPAWSKDATSLLSLLFLAIAVTVGIIGPRDPLTNLLPLTIWTGFWIALFAAIGLAGDLWRYLNPWTGLYGLLAGRASGGWIRLPDRLGVWPGLVLFILYSGFYIVDPAPADPDRLAVLVITYWAFTMVAMALFGGSVWMGRGEAFSVLFGLISRVSVFGDWSRPRIGFPGWGLVPEKPLSVGLGAFALVALGMGSFDGLKETFWWLVRIDVNPLEFPGRSAVVGSSLIGMALASLALFSVFMSALWLGEFLAGHGQPVENRHRLGSLFRHFAPTLLPIALGYHISHFFISFLVNSQYLLATLGDPLANGGNLLGLGQIRVTTGFLNTPASVKTIWLSQASVVVAGHILSVLVSHRVAMKLFDSPRRAALSQIPIGTFMVLYTLFGLWLLASPRGV